MISLPMWTSRKTSLLRSPTALTDYGNDWLLGCKSSGNGLDREKSDP